MAPLRDHKQVSQASSTLQTPQPQTLNKKRYQRPGSHTPKLPKATREATGDLAEDQRREALWNDYPRRSARTPTCKSVRGECLEHENGYCR